MKTDEELRQKFKEAGKSIVLIGFMGAGKTSVAGAMEHILDAPVIDTDAEIEKSEGMTIAAIFDHPEKGEGYFRDLERKVIKKYLEGNEPVILSTGGGAFMNSETRAVILEKSNPVWLKVSKETAYRRIDNDFLRGVVRPVVHGKGTISGDLQPKNSEKKQKEIISQKLEEREPIYALCPTQVDVEGKNPEEIASGALYSLYRMSYSP